MKELRNPKFWIRFAIICGVGIAIWLIFVIRDKPDFRNGAANLFFCESLAFLAVAVQRMMTNNRIATMGPIRGKAARQAVRESGKDPFEPVKPEVKYHDVAPLLLFGGVWLILSFMVSMI